MDCGTDYKQEKEIARGSQGTVCMVHVYVESKILARSKGAQVVGKLSMLSTSQMSVRNRDAFYQEISLHWMFRDTPGFARVYGYAE